MVSRYRVSTVEEPDLDLPQTVHLVVNGYDEETVLGPKARAAETFGDGREKPPFFVRNGVRSVEIEADGLLEGHGDGVEGAHGVVKRVVIADVAVALFGL